MRQYAELREPNQFRHHALTWAGMQYVNWHFERQPIHVVEHEVCLDHISPIKRGIYIQFYEGDIDGSHYYYGIQDLVSDIGGVPEPGFVFSRWGTRLSMHARPGPNGVAVNHDHEDGFIGVRLLEPLETGCMTVRLERKEADVAADWVELSFTKNNVTKVVGALRLVGLTLKSLSLYPRLAVRGQKPMDGAIENSNDIPRYDVRVKATANGQAPQRIDYRYHRDGPPNASSSFDPDDSWVRMQFGGDTTRCTPGELNGDWWQGSWLLP